MADTANTETPQPAKPAPEPPSAWGPQLARAAAVLLLLIGGVVFTWLLNSGKLSSEAYVAGLALVVAASLYLAGPPRWLRPSSEAGTDPRTTARIIAFALIGVYGFALIGTMSIAAYQGVSANNPWLDVFKSGFLLLGGALTSIIGYYFGSRVNPTRDDDPAANNTAQNPTVTTPATKKIQIFSAPQSGPTANNTNTNAEPDPSKTKPDSKDEPPRPTPV
jgi:hypothetical protein